MAISEEEQRYQQFIKELHLLTSSISISWVDEEHSPQPVRKERDPQFGGKRRSQQSVEEERYQQSAEEERYQQFVEDLPTIYETAAELTDQEVQSEIAGMVIQEFGNNQLSIEYIESFQLTAVSPERRVLNFAAATDRVAAVETGIQSFSIKEKMLAKKSKISSEGYRYRTIPITKKVGMDESESSMTLKEQASREKIREIVEGSKFSLQFTASDKKTGAFHVKDRAQNLIRQRTYGSREEYANDQAPQKTKYIVFKTMSDKPGTSEWQHPGTSGKDVAGRVEKWHKENDSRIFNEHVDSLFELFFGD